MTPIAAGKPDLVDPVDLGLDPEKVDALRTRANREVSEGLLPSCQFALARHGQLAVFETLGDATDDNRYVVFSSTKGVTAGAIWLLMGDGLLDVTRPVAEFIPEFATNGKEVVTVEQLLLHTCGFPRGPLDMRNVTTRQQRLEVYARWRLSWEPGTRFEYHPTAAHWVLGDVIQAVSGVDHRQFVQDRIMDPLGLHAFHLGEPADRQADIAALVAVGEPPTPAELEAVLGIPGIDLASLIGEVTTEAMLLFNEPVVREVGAPGAGGISNAADMALYYQALLHNTGDLWDPEVLLDASRTVRNTFPDPLQGVSANRSLGMSVAGDPASAAKRGFGHGLSAETFGHNGAAGQIAWADPVSGISFCYLTNGIDEHLIRQWRRSVGIASRAAVCANED